ncbi:hypothetical protein D3C81_1812350 [compost metagenome]
MRSCIEEADIFIRSICITFRIERGIDICYMQAHWVKGLAGIALEVELHFFHSISIVKECTLYLKSVHTLFTLTKSLR